MQQMLQAAVRDGIKTIIATPHFAPGIEHFPMKTYYDHLLEAQALCETLALPIRVLAGAEIRYTHQTANYLAEGLIPTLGGSNKVLLEFQGSERFSVIEDAVKTVLRNSFVPVIAHIERFRHLVFPLRNALSLKDNYEVYYQVNSETILKNGPQISRPIRQLLQQERIDFVASDTHNLDKRRCQMKETYEKLTQTVGQAYADKLTGNNMMIEDFLGPINEQAISGNVRIDRQKSQLKDAARNMR